MYMKKTAVALGTASLALGLAVGVSAPANASPSAGTSPSATAAVAAPGVGTGVTSVDALEQRGDLVIVRGSTVPGASVTVTGTFGVLGQAGADGAFAIETRGMFPTPTFTVSARLGKLAPDTTTYTVVDGKPVPVADGEQVGWAKPVITGVQKEGYRVFLEGTGVPGALVQVKVTANGWSVDRIGADGTFRVNAGSLYFGSKVLEVQQGSGSDFSDSVFVTVS